MRQILYEHNAQKINESLLVYFKELSESWKPSILWSHWSKLRAAINLRHNININDYKLLTKFMKNYAVGYKPNQSRVISWENVLRFFNTADDRIYLLTKVCTF